MKQKLTIKEIINRGASHRAQRVSLAELRSLRVAFWDIEASGLDADFGTILCAGIKTLGVPGVRVYRIDDSPNYYKRPWDDSWVAEQARDDLEKHDIVVHHYGDRYDVPFLNTRLLGARKRILDSSAMAFVDTWLNIRKRLKLHNNRLMSLISYLGTKTQKTGLDGPLWVLARHANVGGEALVALNGVIKHNIHDVKALEEATLVLATGYDLRYTYVK